MAQTLGKEKMCRANEILTREKGRFVKGHIGYKAMLGRKQSNEAKQKISLASVGRTPWNKGLKMKELHPKSGFQKGHKGFIAKERYKEIARKATKTKERVFQEMKKATGYAFSTEARKRISEGSKGKVLSEEHKRKIGNALKGEKCHLWKGGITSANNKIRTSFEYKQWRTQVFQRDDYRCIDCGARSGKEEKVVLQADHIFSFAQYPRLRLMVENGRTLCLDCHKKTDNYFWKGSKINQYANA